MEPCFVRADFLVKRFRHLALAFRWPVIAALALTAFGLGVGGFLQQANLLDTEMGLLDAGYRSIQLFVLEWNAPAARVPGSLEVARFLAPLVAGLTAAKALTMLFRTEIERLWVRLFGHGHVVVCGQGNKGWQLSRSLRDNGWRVAGIEMSAPTRPVTGWALIPGDATEPETLLRAATQRARHLVALCGNDASNAAVARAARMVGGPDLVIHLLTNEPTLAALLRAEGVMNEDGAPPLEFFTLEGRGAGLLLDSFDISPEQLTVIGESNFAERVAAEAHRRWRGIRVEVLPDSAHVRVAELAASIPVAGHTAVLICAADETRGLTSALGLVQALKQTALGVSNGTVDVIVLSAHAESLTDLVEGSHGPHAAIRLRAFDLYGETLTVELISGGTREAIARAIHDVHQRPASPGTSMGSGTLRPWHELTDDDRASSRAAANAVGSLLRAIGCDLVVAGSEVETPLTLLPSEIELMAMLEHDRWLGWTAEHGELNSHRSRSDWFALPAETRERVEEVVRGLPGTLLQAGQRVVRLERSYARALHTAYVERHLARGETTDDNPSLIPWDRLPASLQDSNRDQMAHLRIKLRSLGLDLAPGEAASPYTLSEEDTDRLAEFEHERWVRHRVFDGWTLGSPKNPTTKVTPYLVPWSELDETTRDTDRDFVRSIPLIAKALGQHVAPFGTGTG